MQVTMLVPAIRKSIPGNLRRIAAYITHKNKTRTKFLRYYCETDLLSTSLPSVTACRIYSNEPDSEPHFTLPALVDGASTFAPSPLTPLKLLYLSLLRITPYIDKEFDITEVLNGAKYATTVISKALANNDLESLEDLVEPDMIETLKTKIETLSPNQRQLIAINEDDILFYVLSDIVATTGDEDFIEITIISHYIQGFKEKRRNMDTMNLLQLSSTRPLVCNYKFARKYVNNIGGPWIATFVNHYSVI